MPETTNLYEELGITKEATVDEVRKAYKKKALLTHPDRLPQGATAEDKAASEEKFRRVNNAYEVLSDANKRKTYDTHGVWPPPEEDDLPSHSWSSRTHHGSFPGRGPYRSQTFPEPFFSSQFQNSFQFTDPFALFDEIFQGTPFSSSSRHHNTSTSSRSPFDAFGPFGRMQTDIDEIMDELDRDPFRRGFSSHGFMGPMQPVTRITTTSFGSGSGRGRFVSESYSSSMVNGVQQSVHKRIDVEGNEHITRTYPDGRQVRTINGVEQTSRERITSHGQSHGHSYSHSRQLPEHSGNRYIHHTPAAPPQPIRMPISVSTTSSSSSRSGFMPQSSMEPPPYSKPPSPISPQAFGSGPRDDHSHIHHHHHRFMPHLHRHRSVSSASSGASKYNHAPPPDPIDVPQRKESMRWWPKSRH
ncbi:hypothetical protein CPB83DRAFT_848640 [Crepidotus variabilis]|uniref:J domain-containing protein n=1 Tax=Crepidotus variabilis TaxID=179855 RepID=A0A9P6EMA1_9AGAR|nr:hypothetical protein CPB83DRAFT_848640 [Crepidotus variabilis]